MRAGIDAGRQVGQAVQFAELRELGSLDLAAVTAGVREWEMGVDVRAAIRLVASVLGVCLVGIGAAAYVALLLGGRVSADRVVVFGTLFVAGGIGTIYGGLKLAEQFKVTVGSGIKVAVAAADMELHPFGGAASAGDRLVLRWLDGPSVVVWREPGGVAVGRLTREPGAAAQDRGLFDSWRAEVYDDACVIVAERVGRSWHFVAGRVNGNDVVATACRGRLWLGRYRVQMAPASSYTLRFGMWGGWTLSDRRHRPIARLDNRKQESPSIALWPEPDAGGSFMLLVLLILRVTMFNEAVALGAAGVG